MAHAIGRSGQFRRPELVRRTNLPRGEPAICVPVWLGRGLRLVQRPDLGPAGDRGVPQLHQRWLHTLGHDGALCLRKLLELDRGRRLQLSLADCRRPPEPYPPAEWLDLPVREQLPCGPYAALRRQCRRLLADWRHPRPVRRRSHLRLLGQVREEHDLLLAMEHDQPVAGQRLTDHLPSRRPGVRRVGRQRRFQLHRA